ncbi:MAG: hypothetical protein GOU99_03780 [Candidatus Altiarchaeota archaeon]|nr:hypothetical protein [Candidatus Altiarchaeota archaeon]
MKLKILMILLFSVCFAFSMQDFRQAAFSDKGNALLISQTLDSGIDDLSRLSLPDQLSDIQEYYEFAKSYNTIVQKFDELKTSSSAATSCLKSKLGSVRFFLRSVPFIGTDCQINEIVDLVDIISTQYISLADLNVQESLDKIQSETGLLNFDWLSFQGIPAAALRQIARDVNLPLNLTDWAFELVPIQIYEVQATYSGEELWLNLSEWDLRYLLSESQELKITNTKPIVIDYLVIPKPDFETRNNPINQISVSLKEIGVFYQAINGLFSSSEQLIEAEYSELLKDTAELKRLYANVSRQELELINESVLISSGILGSSIDRLDYIQYAKKIDIAEFTVPEASIWNRYVAIHDRRTKIGSANKQLTELLESSDGIVQALKYLCESLQRKTGVYDIPCSLSGATLGQRFESIKTAYLKLSMIHKLQLSQENDNRTKTLQEFETILDYQKNALQNLEEFLDIRFVLDIQQDLNDFEIKAQTATQIELIKLMRSVLEIDEKIKIEFWSKNFDKSEKIRVDLAKSTILAASLGLSVGQHEPWLFSRLTVHDSDIKKAMFLIKTGKLELDFLRNQLVDFETQYSSNFPSSFVCEPEVPVLGQAFDVFCSLLINYSFPHELDGLSLVQLKYEPKAQMSSRNFISGNLSLLKSATSQNQVLKIKFNKLASPQIFEIAYRSRLPAANISRISETATSEFYQGQYQIFSDCSFDSAFAVLENPLGGLPANFSLPTHYDGSRAHVLISCKELIRLNISGDPIEIRKTKTEAGILIEAINHLDHALDVLFIQPYVYGASVNTSYSVSGQQMLWRANISSKLAFFINSGFLNDPKCGKDFFVDGVCCNLDSNDPELLEQYNQMYYYLKQSNLEVPNPCELGLSNAIKAAIGTFNTVVNQTRESPEALLFQKITETSQELNPNLDELTEPDLVRKRTAEQIVVSLERRFGPELGNVDRDIIDSVLDVFPYTPRPILVEQRTPPEFLKLKQYFESGDFQAVLEIYLENRQEFELAQIKREFYLDKCDKYTELAIQELEKAKAALSLFSLNGQELVEKAETAFVNKDFISTIYYSRYAILENPVGLGIPYRVPLAIAIIVIGLYLYRTRSPIEEELI